MPEFSNEWAKFNIKNWEKYLSHLKGFPDILFMEIGTYEGQTSLWFLRNILTHKTSKIVIIDPFHYPNPAGSTEKHDLIKERFFNNLGEYFEEDRILFYEEPSSFALAGLINSKLENRFDFIYVDGEHMAKEVLEDAVMSFRLLKKGGIMAFDDYEWKVARSKYGTPKLAVDAFLKVYANKIEILHRGYQLIIKKK